MIVIVPQLGVTRELNQSSSIGVDDGRALRGVEHEGTRVEEGQVAEAVHDAPSHQVNGTASRVVEFDPFTVGESGPVVGGV